MKIDLSDVQDFEIIEIKNLDKIFDQKYYNYILDFTNAINKEIIINEFETETTVLFLNEIVEKMYGEDICMNTCVEVRPFQIVNMSEIVAVMIDGDRKYVFVTENLIDKRDINLANRGDIK